MLRELHVDLDRRAMRVEPADDTTLFGKALAVERMIEADDPERTVYLAAYTPLAAAGLGFAGKLNVYGVSLLGGNLQGSRAGGLVADYLTRLGVVGIELTGDSDEALLLHFAPDGEATLVPVSRYGGPFSGTFDLARALYAEHGARIAVALTDPSSTGFCYNAITCNAKPGALPHRVAGRGTTRFGRNGLMGLVVARAPKPLHPLNVDRKAVSAVLGRIHKAKANVNLQGSADAEQPLLGGTYGAAATGRMQYGHGLTNLFRAAHVPDAVYEQLLPANLVQEQLKRSGESGVPIRRHSCVPGCPNRCVQSVLVPDADAEGGYRAVKAGEWETYQGVINLGLFDDVVGTAAAIMHHSNDHAYDHIEGLVALAALALASEQGHPAVVRYGDVSSVFAALDEAVAGRSEIGLLLRRGAAAIEDHFGLGRHFTVGGHALPFHNGRSHVQTGVGLSWTYGRHGESCAGAGRHNFLGQPYSSSDHSLAAEDHVLNTIHGMILYGALDELGMCFFMGPSVDTLVDCEAILKTLGLDADPRQMVQASAQRIRAIHAFNAARGVTIQPLPPVFYDVATRGNLQTEAEAVRFDVPFAVIRDFGAQVLDDVAEGRVTIPEELLAGSRERHEQPPVA